MSLRWSKIGLVALGAALTMVVSVNGSAAGASYDDSFSVGSDSSIPKCITGGGYNMFVDHGPGAPGGGSNDDYVEIEDSCENGHGVKAWVWLNGVCLEGCHGQYYGYGAWSGPMVWDPFKPYGNVRRGDVVGLKICNVDGDRDKTPTGCDTDQRESLDG
jgi:hypothetical protein